MLLDFMVAEINGYIKPEIIAEVITKVCDLGSLGDCIEIRPIVSIEKYFNIDTIEPDKLIRFDNGKWCGHSGHTCYLPYYIVDGWINIGMPTKLGDEPRFRILNYRYANVKYLNDKVEDKELMQTSTTKLSLSTGNSANKKMLMALLEEFGGWFCESTLKSRFIKIEKRVSDTPNSALRVRYNNNTREAE